MRNGFALEKGIEAVIFGDIPGGGMSRSASLTINLILSLLDANGHQIPDKMKLADLAQAVENDYTGSLCGKLDQIMILFASEGVGEQLVSILHKAGYKISCPADRQHRDGGRNIAGRRRARL